MAERRRSSDSEPKASGLYLSSRGESFFSSGCVLLDCVLGGYGWAEGRVANIVGDKSTGKTLLAIEATANFHAKHPNAPIYYREVESAFDEDYAASLGMPVEKIDFGEDKNFTTVEDIFEDLQNALADESVDHGLYVVDSLDALTSRDEQGRTMDEGSYGTGKAQKMSQLFRRLIQGVGHRRFTIIIISQVRDNIGVSFGSSKTRSGGRALDFYSSQIIWLNHYQTLKKQKNSIERAYGISVRAKATKLKTGRPFRECQFPIIFDYGIDDVEAALDFLKSAKALDRLDLSESGLSAFKKKLAKMNDEEYHQQADSIREEARKEWAEIEADFTPQRRKY